MHEDCKNPDVDLTRINKIAEEYMRGHEDKNGREQGWIYFHGVRTAKIALRLSSECGLEADRDVLWIAGLFHDIAKNQERHNERGADLAEELLKDHCPADLLERIVRTVRHHNQRKKSDSFPVEERIIQDADLIDHCGHIGVWVVFYLHGSHRESFDDHAAYFQSDKQLGWRNYMQSHLNFAESKRILDERLRFEDAFFKEFRRLYTDGI